MRYLLCWSKGAYDSRVYKEWGNMVCFGKSIIVSSSMLYNILYDMVE